MALAFTAEAMGAGPNRFPISVDLSSARCSQLPAGTTIHGEGTAHFSVTSSGLFHVVINGTAADGQGGSWQFNYSQHDGAFATVGAAIRHRLDVAASLRTYDPTSQLLPTDLVGPIGPTPPLRLRSSRRPFSTRATPERLRGLVPERAPSGNATLSFEFGARGPPRR